MGMGSDMGMPSSLMICVAKYTCPAVTLSFTNSPNIWVNASSSCAVKMDSGLAPEAQ